LCDIHIMYIITGSILMILGGGPRSEGRGSRFTYRLTCDRIHHVMLVPVPTGARGGAVPPRLRQWMVDGRIGEDTYPCHVVRHMVVQPVTVHFGDMTCDWWKNSLFDVNVMIISCVFNTENSFLDLTFVFFLLAQ
jgi:hypothetical protein